MPIVANPVSTSQPYIPGVQAAQLGRFPGFALVFADLSALNLAVTAERGNITDSSALWANGQPLATAQEAAQGIWRTWLVSGQHARTAVLRAGLTSVLPTDSSVVLFGASDPSGGTGVDGDVYINTTAGVLWKKAAGAWAVLAALGGGGAVSSVAGRTGAVTLTKADVSLSSVDNTSDASKPVSTATAAALDGMSTATATALDGMSTATAAALAGKQASLVSNTNIKTVNNESILGAGNVISPANSLSGTIAVIGNSITAYYRPGTNGFLGVADWLPSKAYTAGNFVLATNAFDPATGGLLFCKYQASNSGTSGGTSIIDFTAEPVWPTAIGATVVDGGVTWTAVAIGGDPGWQFNWWMLAQALSGQRLREVFYGGSGGLKAASLAKIFRRAMEANPEYISLCNWFENDVKYPAYASTLADAQAVWNTFYACAEEARLSGKKLLLSTVFPRSDTDGTGAFAGYTAGIGTRQWYWFNAKIREYARKYRNQVIFTDPAKLFINKSLVNPVWPDNTTTFQGSGATQTTKYTDGVPCHPYQAAHWAWAREWARQIASDVPFVDHFSTGALDYYNPLANPSLLQISGGNSVGGTQTGTMATDFADGLSIFTGQGSTALSRVARTDAPGPWQRMAQATSTGSAYPASIWNVVERTSIPIANANFAIGDVVEYLQEIRVLSAGVAGLGSLTSGLNFNGATEGFTKSIAGSGYNSSEQYLSQFVAEDTTLILRTPPIRVPIGTTSISTSTQALSWASTPCNPTVDMGRRVVRRPSIPDIA
jgi:hypothetical protein